MSTIEVDNDGGFLFCFLFFRVAIIFRVVILRGNAKKKEKKLSCTEKVFFPLHFVCLFSISVFIAGAVRQLKRFKN